MRLSALVYNAGEGGEVGFWCEFKYLRMRRGYGGMAGSRGYIKVVSGFSVKYKSRVDSREEYFFCSAMTGFAIFFLQYDHTKLGS